MNILMPPIHIIRDELRLSHLPGLCKLNLSLGTISVGTISTVSSTGTMISSLKPRYSTRVLNDFLERLAVLHSSLVKALHRNRRLNIVGCLLALRKPLSLCQQTSNDYVEMILTSTWNVQSLVGKYFHEHIDAPDPYYPWWTATFPSSRAL